MTLNEVQLPCLTDKVKHDLQTLAMQGMPEEVCGILHHHGIIHQFANTYPGDKRLGFDMDVPSDCDIAAVWHSHPGGLPNPSRDDIPVMELLYSKGIFAPWIIVTRHSVLAWELNLQIA